MSGELEAIRTLAETGNLVQAIEKLESLLEAASEEDVRMQAEALELLGRCRQGTLQMVQAMEAFAAAAQLYSQADDDESESYCELLKVRQLLDDRLLREARALISASHNLAGKQGWQDMRALAFEFGGLASFHVKEHTTAVRQFKEALARPDRRKLTWEELVLRMSMGVCYLALGDIQRGREELSAIHADPRTNSIPRLGVYALMNLGYADWLACDYSSAHRHFSAVVEMAGQDSPTKGMRWLLNMANYNLGLVYMQLGDYEQAFDIMIAAWRVTREQGQYQLTSACLSSLCIISLMLNQTREALQFCTLCSELAQKHDDYESHLLPYYMAVAYMANDQVSEAIKCWRNKPVLENNIETRLQYSWLVGLLDHIINRAELELSQAAQNLAWQWRGEIFEYAHGESLNRALP